MLKQDPKKEKKLAAMRAANKKMKDPDAKADAKGGADKDAVDDSAVDKSKKRSAY